MITQRARYALKTMLHLAQVAGERVSQVSEIAERQQIPIKFLEQIMIDLRRAGLIISKRGRYGGYLLARPAEQINLLTILRAIDGPVAPLGCLSMTAYSKCEDCDDEATCGVRLLLRGVYQATLRSLELTTLAQGLKTTGGGIMESSIRTEQFTWDLDQNGFLKDFEKWNKEFVYAMSQRLGMGDLSDAHWQVIEYIRAFFLLNKSCPLVYQTCRANQLRLRDLNALFPKGYLRGACRLAGLSYTTGYPSFAELTQYTESPSRADLILANFQMDAQGFLQQPDSWDRDFATSLAEKQGHVEPLSDRHWQVLYYLREAFHEDLQVPTVYQTCHDLRMEIEELEQLFPAGYNRGAVRLAGLRPGAGEQQIQI